MVAPRFPFIVLEQNPCSNYCDKCLRVSEIAYMKHSEQSKGAIKNAKYDSSSLRPLDALAVAFSTESD